MNDRHSLINRSGCKQQYPELCHLENSKTGFSTIQTQTGTTMGGGQSLTFPNKNFTGGVAGFSNDHLSLPHSASLYGKKILG
jgi:hypothetical protein